ncbi:cell envelope-related function transcriptional attenuator common domain-containing protein [Actinomyces ruminicola]|uniref:Cell envelope-related function transcriptional attenuator common domain-containing protein n=2 Tax=Actinomyces ruminicola TaxID=332524 RepID=A0A1G9ZRU1_9ACTO|nr:cell envelope-related function transcriptional attenuator common domain-containing protein [Actinomyces ruminicola]
MIMAVSSHAKAKPNARHSAKDLTRRAARRLLLAGFAVVLFIVSGVGIAYHDLQSQVNTLDINGLLDDDRARQVTDSYEGRPVNILILGTDSRAGANNVDGSEGSEEVAVARSDTTMILHLPADRSRIEIVSIPRDLLVDIPSCRTADGGTTEAMSYTPFNTAFANGAGASDDDAAVAAGVACTLATIEDLTGLYIDEYLVVDFNGLTTTVDALGGVNLYVDEDINDTEFTGLVMSSGCQHLDGATALQYARVRHGVGDGSDRQRMPRQQNLVAAMLRTAKSKNYFTDADALYSFARAALGSLTSSPGIGSLTTLAGLAMSISDVGMDQTILITMPNEEAPWDLNRALPTDEAADVWAALKADTPISEALRGDTQEGADSSSDADSADATQEDQPTQSDAGSDQPDAAADSRTPTADATTEDPAAQCY